MVKVLGKSDIQVKKVATLSGLENSVVQAFKWYGEDGNSYVIQYDPETHTVRCFMSDSPDDLPSSTNLSVSYNQLFSLENNPSNKVSENTPPFGGHTQTLLQDPYFIVTGLNEMIFENIYKLLGSVSQDRRDLFFRYASAN